MALTRGKIIKANNEEPDEVEKAISQVDPSHPLQFPNPPHPKALLDLEVNSDLKAALRELHITAAKEVAARPLTPLPPDAAFRLAAAGGRDPR
jgi:small subunit ribosomal protein S7e